MAIPSVGNTGNGVTSTATTVDATITTVAGDDRILLVFAGFHSNDGGGSTGDITAVTIDPGGSDEASFTYEAQVTNDYHAARRCRTEVWFLKDTDFPATDGSYTVRATYDNASSQESLAITAMQIDDVDQTDPIGANGTSTGNGTAQSVDVTTTATNSLVVACSDMAQMATTHTPGTGDTEIVDHNHDPGGSNLDHTQGSFSTDAATITTYTVSTTAASGANYCMIGVEIFEAAGAETQAVAGVLSFAGAVDLKTGKPLAGTLTTGGTIAKETGRPLAGTVSFAGDLVKKIALLLAGVISFSGSLSPQVVFTKLLEGVISFSGAINKQVSKAIAGIASFTGDVVKKTSTSLAGTLSFIGSLSASTGLSQTLAGAVNFGGSVNRKVGKALSGSLSFAGALLRKIATSLAGTLGFTGETTKKISTTLSGAISFVGSLASSIVGDVITPKLLTILERTNLLTLWERTNTVNIRGRTSTVTIEDED